MTGTRGSDFADQSRRAIATVGSTQKHRETSPSVRWATALALLATLACDADGAATTFHPITVSPRPKLIVPNQDIGENCADVGSNRVCWSSVCDGGICVMPRALPEQPPATEMGWRCTGSGSQRSCYDRAMLADEFRCDGQQCEQRVPRLPDSGDWECFDYAGSVICHGGTPAAGVVPSPPAPGWRCGVRRAGTDQRVCVDFSPDFPDGLAYHWTCKFDSRQSLRRVCRRRPGALAPQGCELDRQCLDGAVCRQGRCVPQPPRPSCILDRECPDAVCRWGSCVARDSRP